MTDYEKLKKCFDEIGIEYRESKGIPSFIQIENNGYDILQFIFDDQGKYIEIQ